MTQNAWTKEKVSFHKDYQWHCANITWYTVTSKYNSRYSESQSGTNTNSFENAHTKTYTHPYSIEASHSFLTIDLSEVLETAFSGAVGLASSTLHSHLISKRGKKSFLKMMTVFFVFFKHYI